jgi:hypothetical protein
LLEIGDGGLDHHAVARTPRQPFHEEGARVRGQRQGRD